MLSSVTFILIGELANVYMPRLFVEPEKHPKPHFEGRSCFSLIDLWSQSIHSGQEEQDLKIGKHLTEYNLGIQMCFVTIV